MCKASPNGRFMALAFTTLVCIQNIVWLVKSREVQSVTRVFGPHPNDSWILHSRSEAIQLVLLECHGPWPSDIAVIFGCHTSKQLWHRPGSKCVTPKKWVFVYKNGSKPMLEGALFVCRLEIDLSVNLAQGHWSQLESSQKNNAMSTTHFPGMVNIPPFLKWWWLGDGGFMALFYPHVPI